jgi:uncharacterized protein YecE (DUF72 family)
MKFGHTTDLLNQNFELADWKVCYQKSLLDENNMLNLFSGDTQWTHQAWKGNIYPNKIDQKDMLEAYANQFNSIELNSTYYAIPKKVQIEKWEQSTPSDFKFCPKVLMQISNNQSLAYDTGLFHKYVDMLYHFKQKLGVPFLQFPSNGLAKTNIAKLKKLGGWFPEDLPLAIEFRHSSNYNEASIAEITGILSDNNWAMVITDTAGRRDIVHSYLTSSESLFVRFVNSGDFELDKIRIGHWLTKFEELRKTSISTIYFFLHEGDHTILPQLSLYLYSQVKNISGFAYRGPVVSETNNNQLELFKNE